MGLKIMDDVATGAAAEDAKAITERVKTHMHTFLYNSNLTACNYSTFYRNWGNFTHWKNKNKQSWEVVTTRCLWGSINRWIKKVAVFWVAWKEGGLPFDPQLRERRQPAAKRRLTQKLRVRSYHHPDDIGACLLPSDINPLGQCYWDV